MDNNKKVNFCVASLIYSVADGNTKEQLLEYMGWIYDKLASLEDGTGNTFVDISLDMVCDEDAVKWEAEFCEHFGIENEYVLNG